MAISPLNSICAGIVSTAIGARLGTVTVNSWLAASPSVSVAVTVTTASPFASAVTVRVLPDTETPATPGRDEVAA